MWVSLGFVLGACRIPAHASPWPRERLPGMPPPTQQKPTAMEERKMFLAYAQAVLEMRTGEPGASPPGRPRAPRNATAPPEAAAPKSQMPAKTQKVAGAGSAREGTSKAAPDAKAKTAKTPAGGSSGQDAAAAQGEPKRRRTEAGQETKESKPPSEEGESGSYTYYSSGEQSESGSPSREDSPRDQEVENQVETPPPGNWASPGRDGGHGRGVPRRRRTKDNRATTGGPPKLLPGPGRQTLPGQEWPPHTLQQGGWNPQRWQAPPGATWPSGFQDPPEAYQWPGPRSHDGWQGWQAPKWGHRTGPQPRPSGWQPRWRGARGRGGWAAGGKAGRKGRHAKGHGLVKGKGAGKGRKGANARRSANARERRDRRVRAAEAGEAPGGDEVQDPEDDPRRRVRDSSSEE